MAHEENMLRCLPHYSSMIQIVVYVVYYSTLTLSVYYCLVATGIDPTDSVLIMSKTAQKNK